MLFLMRKEKKFLKAMETGFLLPEAYVSTAFVRLAKLMSNWGCWLVDTGGAAVQVVCSCTCLCLLVLAHQLSCFSGPLNSLPLQHWVFAVADLKHAAWWRSQPHLQGWVQGASLDPPWRGDCSMAHSFAEAAVAHKASTPNVKCLAAGK